MKNWKNLNKELIYNTIVKRDISNPKIIEAIQNTPRHLFIPEQFRDYAYGDHPVPIGFGQTISQPFIVAYMIEQLEPSTDCKVLEVGTGSGYNAAVLSQLVKEIHTIEIIPELKDKAEKTINSLHIKNVFIYNGDGSRGLVEKAPFDRIIVTAAAPSIPESLIEQLKIDGIMIIPVDAGIYDILKKVEKKNDGLHITDLISCTFVPLLGRNGFNNNI